MYLSGDRKRANHNKDKSKARLIADNSLQDLFYKQENFHLEFNLKYEQIHTYSITYKYPPPTAVTTAG